MAPSKTKPASQPRRQQAEFAAGALTSFWSGPNFRDSPSELAATETFGSWNITYDERGGATSRLGYAKRNATPLGAAGDKIVNDYYSGLLGKHLTQSGKKLYLNDNTTSVHTFTTTDCVTFTEMGGKVIAAHPADGIFTSTDGSTWVVLADLDAPTQPLCVAVWQQRLWVGLTDGSVHWSAPGDPLTWAATDFNEIWTKDQQPIVALQIGSGQDIQGRPGLLAFKQESVYRINDPATGAYTVVDATQGAAGPKAVVGVGGRVCWIGTHGVYWWREDQAQPVNASDLLLPLWRGDELSLANAAGWCAGRRLNRALFSCSSVASSVNDLAFEFHPDEGWIAPRSDAMACYSTTKGTTNNTSGGSTTADGQLYTLDTGGTDDGAAIAWWMQTRWVVPNGGFQATLWLVRTHGRGAGTMTVRTDTQDGGGTDYPFDLGPHGSTWGGFTWGDGTTWMSQQLQETEVFYGLGVCRSFSLRFSGSSSDTGVGRVLFGNAGVPSVGSFGLFGVEYLTVPLGSS